MRILEVVPKKIEVIFSLDLEDVRRLDIVLCETEVGLSMEREENKKAFDTLIEFHDLLKKLLVEIKDA